MLIKEGKTDWKLLLIVVILATIVGGGILWCTMKQETLVTQLPEIRILKDETANWKTYRSEEYGVELKYPLDWNIGQPPEFKETLIVAPKSIIEEMNKIQWATGGGIFLTISINKSTERPTFESDEYTRVVEEKPVVVGNSPATEYTALQLIDLPGIPKDSVTISIVAEIGETFYKIELLDNQYRDIFNQILSNFKFLEKFCGWSTYGECSSDSDCLAGGCSSQVCYSKNEEPIVTTCEWRDCYNADTYGVSCKCVENKCQWTE